ncbi:MAG: amidohydrolase family protein [Thermoleophilaceae bacterium]
MIDGHTHVWPDAIARRALANPSAELQRYGDGTVNGLAATMEAAGVDRSVCLAVGDVPERVDKANRFVGELDSGHFVPAGTVHPGLPVEENMQSLRRAGVRAVKIHPLFQGFALDDPGLADILDAIQGEFPAIIHVGAGGEHHGGERCTPAMLRDVARRFPRLDLIACHFGGYRMLERAEEEVVGLPVYLDTSWPPGLGSLDRSRVRALMERHGLDRIVFASDWPMADPGAEIATVEGLGFSAADTEAILGGTLARLLGLS